MNKRIFSGIQPTGQLTLGNYLGALKNWDKMQSEGECIYSIVDQHAITVSPDPVELKNATLEVAAGVIASGIDYKKHILFHQSGNPNHTELGWYFNCIARMGWLNRMTQFKEKAGKNAEKSSVGLFAYPNLQAADILAYHATHVPVGEDQKQHLELCRDIAQKFNHDYGVEFFPVIEPIINEQGGRIMSLKDGKNKMSKSDPSDNSRINLVDDKDTIAKKFKKATSDADLLPSSKEEFDGRPEAENLISIYATLQDKTIDDVLPEVGGLGWGDFKGKLADVAVATISPISDEINRLMSDKAEIENILNDGARKSREISQPIIDETKKILGFI
ncbi:MAG: tryptophan--tRNA ligase [Alphaproteobacteria bacterium]